MPRASVLVACVFGACMLGGCRDRASNEQCGQLVDQFARLSAAEHLPSGSAAEIAAESTREALAARNDDAFKNCTTEVTQGEFQCAKSAKTAAELLRCLE